MPVFTSRFVDSLPGDPVENDRRSRPVPGALWSRVDPTPVAAPRMVASSPEVAELLGLSPEVLASEEALAVLSGNALWPGMKPWAANYGGFQFGHWAGQLGDGRAIGLGELEGPDGRTWELQLKGAGPTPYSRRGDGRAVLRSSIREFLCSEAMAHLGVPTTRALSLVSTGEQVVRDMFYDGHPAPEPGAIVCRVAPSFVRFGSFELCARRDDVELLRRLAEDTLKQHYPELGPPSPEAYAEFFREVARRTARLIAHWQAVGFVHGVMNTDNLSILGLTIDYGPYGWLDDYDPHWTPNTTDAQQRRYRYGNQPSVGLWNLESLGEALAPLFGEALAEQAQREGLEAYQHTFILEQARRFAHKLGLASLRDDADLDRVQQLFDWLGDHETDFTIFFRRLAQVVTLPQAPTHWPEVLDPAFYSAPSEAHLEVGLAWLRSWWHRTREESRSPEEIAASMDRVNPLYVLRNWLSQEAIDAAHAGDDSRVHALQEVMRHPFDEQPGREHYAQKRPEWARNKPGCSALSCSS